MRTLLAVLSLCFAGGLVTPSFSQNVLDRSRYELTGNFSLAWHRDEDTTPSYNGSTYEPHRNTHISRTFVLNPSFGALVGSGFELFVECSYSLSWSSVKSTPDWILPDGLSLGPLQTYINTPGIGTVLLFNYPITESIIPFAGIRAAVSWTKVIQKQGPRPSFALPWSIPSIHFPSFLIGTRLFFAEHWAISIRALYEYRSNEFSSPNRSTHSFNLDYGVTALF